MKVLSSNKCKNIITFYGAFFTEGNVKIILEYMNVGSLEKIFKAIQGKVNAYKQKDSETAIKENREETKTENPEERTTEPGDKTITLQEQALKGIGDYDLNADYIKNVAAGLYVDKTIGQQHESEANEI